MPLTCTLASVELTLPCDWLTFHSERVWHRTSLDAAEYLLGRSKKRPLPLQVQQLAGLWRGHPFQLQSLKSLALPQ